MSRLSWGQENARTGDLRLTPAVVLVKGGRRVWEGKPQKIDSKPCRASNLPITLAGFNPWRWDMSTWVQRSQQKQVGTTRNRGNACTRPSSHFQEKSRRLLRIAAPRDDVTRTGVARLKISPRAHHTPFQSYPYLEPRPSRRHDDNLRMVVGLGLRVVTVV
jgi:hypothetical protein